MATTTLIKRPLAIAAAAWADAARRALALDILERLFVLVLMTLFLIRLAPMIGNGPCNILIAISESLGAILILVRRPGAVLASPYAWTIAIAGTCAPLLVAPGGERVIPWVVSATLMATGLAFSISAKAFLWRSFGILPANRGVRSGGPYGIVRHPMYAGYLFTHAGFLLSSFCLRNIAAYAICWGAMALRIRAEEAILSQDPAYRAYQGKVRSRLFPFVW
jgi:protein-S-isoprenylcysteine O-methyltransferase Ste14